MRNILRYLWYLVCRHLLIYMSNSLFFNLTAYINHKRFGWNYKWMDVRNPKSFSEKLQYLKINPVITNATILADKYKVREYVKESVGEQYLVPLIGVWKNADDINFDKLPNQFILKANHGSGWNIICRDKTKLNIPETKRRLNRWLTMNAYYLSREWQYKNIPPVIVGEELLQYNILDYKFFCFNGQPQYVQIDISRFTNHTRVFYDMEWNIMPFNITYSQPVKSIKRPTLFEEMKRIASILSRETNFVRIDLYVHDNQVYFGEITICPGGGTEAIIPYEYDIILGEMINDTPQNKY